MLRQKAAILSLLAVIFIYFSDFSVSAQCGPGKVSENVQGFGTRIVADFAYGGVTGVNALGYPDGVGTYFSNNGQYIIVDLIDTVRAGQTYSFIWRQHQSMPGSAIIWWAESVDGVSFTNHPQSGILSTSTKVFFNTQITANTDTRYLRIYMGAGSIDFYLDAILYNAVKCLTDNCGAGYTSRIVSGNGLPLVSADQNGVDNFTNLSGAPDGRSAYFNSSGDWAIINLPVVIPAGQQYTLIWRPVDV